MFIGIFWTNPVIWGTMLPFVSMSSPFWVLFVNSASYVVIFFWLLVSECINWVFFCFSSFNRKFSDILDDILPVFMGILVSSLRSISIFSTFASAVHITIFSPWVFLFLHYAVFQYFQPLQVQFASLFSLQLQKGCVRAEWFFHHFHFFQFQVLLLFQIS